MSCYDHLIVHPLGITNERRKCFIVKFIDIDTREVMS